MLYCTGMKNKKTILILVFVSVAVLLSAQVHKVTTVLETRKQPAVSKYDLFTSFDVVGPSDNRWNLEDGIYLAKEILIHSPELICGTRNRGPDSLKTAGVFINKGRMFVFEVNEYGITYFPNYDCSLGDWLNPILNEGINREDVNLFYINERSGGGDYAAFAYDGTNLNILFFTAECGYTEQVTYILEKDAADMTIRYDIAFPLYVNLTECRAYSTSDVRGIPDVLIKGNQRDLREEYYFAWGPLSEEGKSNIVELVDLFQIHGIWVYEGIYQGKSVFIKKEAISNYPRIYTSIDNLESAIWYENGL